MAAKQKGGEYILIPVGESPQLMSEKLQIATDPIGLNILKLIKTRAIKKQKAFFNDITRELTKKDIGSRRTIHSRIVRLENVGLISSQMSLVVSASENSVKRWVREFFITPNNSQWIGQLIAQSEK